MNGMNPGVWLNVFGGLAIFIFGMKMMSDGLHRAAGERMRNILRLFSANRLIALLSGALVTAVIQSSSASTVMVIGFVNAGLLNLVQAIGIVFGANIGTTVTAQLVSFDIGWVVMPAIILGLLLSFITRPGWNGWGETVIGFGFLFLGMNLMSDELRVLAEHPSFVSAFQTFNCAPVAGVMPPGAVFGAIGIGLLTTLIIQSSSACTGIIIALGAGGLIDLYTAVALVLGSNIGTTVTAQLAAIPANRVAKQTALAHTLFNLIGVILVTVSFWLPWGGSDGVPLFFRCVEWLPDSGDLPRRIANAHTLFNILTACVLLPGIPLLAKICEKVLPVREAKVKYRLLEPYLLDTPEIALSQTIAALRKMLRKAWRMNECALGLYDHDNAHTRARAAKLDAQEQRVDAMQREITDYLACLMRRPLLPPQAARIPLLIHCTNDAERIGDHTAIIRKLVMEFRAGGGHLSQAADGELARLRKLLVQQAHGTLELLSGGATPERAAAVARLAVDIVTLSNRCEAEHLKRLERKQCLPATGIFYIELLSEIRKVSRHLENISERAGALSGVK